MKISNFKSKYWNIGDILFIILIVLIFYWPFTFGVFSAKNDNITQFLPVRFNVSEALRHGHLPLWSPYIYLGYPIHGDMQGGSWNPFVRFLSIFGRYNLTSLHAEILIYIFCAAAGMYRLLGIFGISRSIRLIGSVAYLYCGYITDVAGSNLPFLAAAAFIPFVFAYYYHLLSSLSWTYSLKTAFALTLLFVCGYPSFFILTFYVLFVAFLTILIRKFILKDTYKPLALVYSNILLGAVFVALAAPAIVSYLQIIPFYQRGSGVSLAGALENSFHPSCIASVIFPSAPIKNPASALTDLISKNIYFNSFLFVFSICYYFNKKTFILNFTALGIIFFLLFSLGEYTPIREWCYDNLPLMDTFRHPSNTRLFVIIGGIILGANVFQSYKSGHLPNKGPQRVAVLLSIVTLIVSISVVSKISVWSGFQELLYNNESYRIALKNYFESLNHYDHLFINSLIQLIFFLSLIVLLHRRNLIPTLYIFFIANSFVFAQLSIPYTLVSKSSPKTINYLLNKYPQGFPFPDKNQSIAENSKDALMHFTEIGIASFYNKKIATSDEVMTPTFMTPMEHLNNNVTIKDSVLSRPYAFFSSTISLFKRNGYNLEEENISYKDTMRQVQLQRSKNEFHLNQFWNNGFSFITSSTNKTFFLLQQLHLPGWRAYIDKKQVNILDANIALMAVMIPEGNHEVKFIYKPQGITAGLILSITILLVSFFLLLKKKANHL